MGLPMGWNSCLSPCRWFSWADDVPSVFTRKNPKPHVFHLPYFPITAVENTVRRNILHVVVALLGNFLLLRHGFLLAVRELNWKISRILPCCSQRLHMIIEEWLLSLKKMIKKIGVSMVPLLSCTCTGLIALIPPTRKARVDTHTGTYLCSWHVYVLG